MPSKPRTVEFIVEQLHAAGSVSAKKMFGEYGIYCDGKIVALVCDDRLFVKPTEAGRALLGDVAEAAPYPQAKPWFLIDGERWDDDEWLSRLIRISAAQLPPPKPKAPTKSKRAKK